MENTVVRARLGHVAAVKRNATWTVKVHCQEMGVIRNISSISDACADLAAVFNENFDNVRADITGTACDCNRAVSG